MVVVKQLIGGRKYEQDPEHAIQALVARPSDASPLEVSQLTVPLPSPAMDKPECLTGMEAVGACCHGSRC